MKGACSGSDCLTADISNFLIESTQQWEIWGLGMLIYGHPTACLSKFWFHTSWNVKAAGGTQCGKPDKTSYAFQCLCTRTNTVKHTSRHKDWDKGTTSGTTNNKQVKNKYYLGICHIMKGKNTVHNDGGH